MYEYMYDIYKHESLMPLGDFWYVPWKRGHLNWGLDSKQHSYKPR